MSNGRSTGSGLRMGYKENGMWVGRAVSDCDLGSKGNGERVGRESDLLQFCQGQIDGILSAGR